MLPPSKNKENFLKENMFFLFSKIFPFFCPFLFLLFPSVLFSYKAIAALKLNTDRQIENQKIGQLKERKTDRAQPHQ